MRAIALLGLAGCQVLFPLDAADATPSPECPTSYEPGIHGVYRVAPIAANWLVAEETCEGDRTGSGFTHLVVASSASELAELHELLPGGGSIGLSDEGGEGTYRWITTEATTFAAGTLPSPAPAPWATGQPDDFGIQNCAATLDTGELDDVDCLNDKLAFLCECDAFAPR